MRTAGILACFLAAAMSSSTPDQMETFHKAMKMKESSRIFKVGCMACHTDPPKHNPFGKEIKAVLKSTGNPMVTLEILRSIRQKDSDGDGWSNEVELSLDTLPGDPESRPAGVPLGLDPSKMLSEAKVSVEANQNSWLEQVFPKHSFHPVVIHFPIALFMFGATLEVFGWRRKQPNLRQAGWLGLLFGALSTLLAVPTGLLVFFRNGFPWQGTALIHFVLAVIATLLMTTTVLWRRKAAHESLTYFALLLLAALAVSLAGHFGGQLVYGV